MLLIFKSEKSKKVLTKQTVCIILYIIHTNLIGNIWKEEAEWEEEWKTKNKTFVSPRADGSVACSCTRCKSVVWIVSCEGIHTAGNMQK